ncbi:MAG: Eco57I restriction-modification methylase [Candidatus Argoarchaeum ethanivorans]|uniref:site-specific DNA-methyltransferase (adenine-specific) n=1 Tax=Candidatus Argoarchaeum ethanivorans TaxID=2608793 RepID=A0A811T9U6_9EURY|nr:MAG: Eco57I restriction-modification methylase [Candidatus Argoarchaeum ethanivorans]
MSHKKLREQVEGLVSKINSAEEVYRLFELLNYPKKNLFDVSFKRKIEEFNFRKDERDKIKDIYTVMSFEKDLPVFLIEAKSLSPPFIRYVTKVFSDRHLRLLLIFTINYEDLVFAFPQFQKVETGKHKLRITRLDINKNETYYTDIETLSNLFYKEEATWRDVWLKWKKAFSVEQVTDKFFNNYQNEFFRIRDELVTQSVSKKDAHAFTLQFLNRIMFIYFISKKRWLNNDPKFMRWLWNRYLQERSKGSFDKDSFYDLWLKPLFFEAFNGNKNQIFDRDLSDDIKKVLLKAPYLNGSLFKEDKELDRLSVKIDDSLFKSVFEFFERYNFTIRENMPLDQEVAVDPQMIGYVYESLANVAEKIYDQNDLGIFYTPRVEVDFMCRQSLVEYLGKSLPDMPKPLIYEFVFDEDKKGVEKYFEKEKCWYRLEEVLEGLSVVDPACGSGAFLVGMLNVLAELYKVVYKYTKRDLGDFELKKRIINRSLYGVDVMAWALGAAELRLWLQLIIESDLRMEDLQKEPLLPNLDINLRVGDSLVQEIGGIKLHLRDSDIPKRLKKKLDDLKREKENYFYNLKISKFKDKEGLIREEARIVEEIAEDRILDLESREKSIKEYISKLKKVKQMSLSGKVSLGEQQKIFDVKKEKEKELERIERQIQELEKVKVILDEPEKKPFVWDIDFAEIFGDKNGFDIVIGNPPYVRQEKISPPNRLKEEVTLEDRREYKEKLIKSVIAHLPVIEKIDKKSDYYIYFYLHGLSLLNKEGTFCFITSNSWLDVGYGKGLQEFLLKYVPLIAIYDNQAKRSFEHADVNTIIALFGAPVIEEDVFGDLRSRRFKGNCLKNTVRFVMFKKPFEEVLSPQNLIDIESAEARTRRGGITELVKNVVKTDDYRVFPMVQEDLLEDGWEYPEGYDPEKDGRFKKGKYAGNKWGGKYLRAPDIFFTILEKGKGKLVRLGDIAEVRFGIKTGANEFFYLPSKHFDIKEEGNYYRLIPKKEGLPDDIRIEGEFLQSVIKSSKESKTPYIDRNKLNRLLFLCNVGENELIDKEAFKYIEWGETQGFNQVPSCKSRKYWWSLGKRRIADIIIPPGFGDIFRAFSNRFSKVYADKRLYEIYYDEADLLHCYLNCTLFPMFADTGSRISLGDGLLDLTVEEFEDILVTKSDIFNETAMTNKFLERDIGNVFTEAGINPSKPIREQEPHPLPDRAELDNIVFDELGLTEEERKEVYWAVCELVKQRLEKARSLKK